MVRSLLLAGIVLGALGGSALAAPCPAGSTATTPIAPPPVLNLNGVTCELSGVHTYTSITLTNSTINVDRYTGGNKAATGNLELRSLTTITIDATSTISAKGAGYQTRLCGNGQSRTASGGGRGGCSLLDSGGGGAHFGIGGRGTRDNPAGNAFYENDCSVPYNALNPALGGSGITVSYNGSGVATCTREAAAPSNSCRAFGAADAVPTVAGLPYVHSIYDPDFGGSGGDKGCLDGDGRDPTDTPFNFSNFDYGIVVGGGGGGRIVLAAVSGTGQITINGKLNANGKRGCGSGNDSGGGGAGGTIFVVGDNVTIGATAEVTSTGGLGGDTQGLGTDPTGECVTPAQQGQNADDCGGGGGGGIISVLSGTSADINDRAVFNVNGAAGGVSTICRGEAGGGVGELQISGGYVGEFCDGFDNDFNDMVDELPTLDCGGSTVMSCVGGLPQQCPAVLPTCQTPVTDTRTRFAVIVDTSGSMLGDLGGQPTFGDGSIDRPGLDQDSDANAIADDSRLFKAKRALVNVISAYPSIDFALARYHQDQSVDRSCQTAHNFECNKICCTYDNPTNNVGAMNELPACSTEGANGALIDVYKDSPGDTECVNYAGNCGPPRRGADVVAGFGSDINNYLMWLDGTETNFINTTTPGAYCDFGAGGNCEFRGTGPTPLANSLNAIEDYLSPIKTCDVAASNGGCRKYNVILLTDGAESCQGAPDAAAAALRMKGINTYVVGFSTLGTETAQLNAIAAAGGTGTAFIATDEESLANALAQIVSGSIVFETCNNMDDDCDGRIDEDFPQKNSPCNDGEFGKCLGTGTLGCNGTGTGLQCNITMPGDAPTMEVCNGEDDNCNGAIDEGLDCNGCVPVAGPDVCDGVDSNCNGVDGEGDPDVGDPCGVSDTPPCELGVNRCIGGNIVCVGNRDPQSEVCNGLDDNCDGMTDLNASCPGATSCVEGGCRVPCAGGEFSCPVGFRCDTTPTGDFCVPSACANCSPNEICQNDTCVDPCAGVTCQGLEQCRFGTCVDCNVFGCQAGQVCLESMCVADPCDDVDCAAECTNPAGCSCRNGSCFNNCDDTLCPTGQLCNTDGACAPDECAGVECDEGDICRDGACQVDPCNDVVCRAGQACVDNECIDDPCKLVECSDEFSCVLRDGVGVCAPDNPAGRQILVQAGGGGGCATGGGSGAGMLLVGLAFIMRRRRDGRTA